MLEYLARPIPELVSQLSPADLKTIQDQLDAAAERLKKQKDIFSAVMARRFEESARAAYAAANKDTGTVNIAASNTLNLKIDVPKKVEWDQAKLYSIFSAMAPEDAKHFAKVEYKVEEAKYKAAPPAVQAKLKTARTVKAGTMKFVLVNAESADETQEAA